MGSELLKPEFWLVIGLCLFMAFILGFLLGPPPSYARKQFMKRTDAALEKLEKEAGIDS